MDRDQHVIMKVYNNRLLKYEKEKKNKKRKIIESFKIFFNLSNIVIEELIKHSLKINIMAFFNED